MFEYEHWNNHFFSSEISAKQMHAVVFWTTVHGMENIKLVTPYHWNTNNLICLL